MKIVLGVSGGIAAYKAPDLVRRLQERGASVRVILTPNGARFVSPLALSAVSNFGVITEQWGDASHGGVDHIEIARWADVLLIAPATANVIAKLAVGIADDALTTYALAHRGRIVIAPAMNTFMLLHPTVQQNLDTLRKRGVVVFEPDQGLLACGDEGAGRMPDPHVIAERVIALRDEQDLAGRRIVVTAGPTREPIDPVRYITNRSSGKMGYAVAEAAAARGAEVTLISGPTSLVVPYGVSLVSVMTAEQMRDAVMTHAAKADALVKAAAVADYTAADVATEKIKRKREGELSLALKPTPDILEAVRSLNPKPLVVAFAAETNDVIENARAKLVRKGADFIVANDVSDTTIGFDVDENQVTVLDAAGESYHFERASKRVIADRILDLVVSRISSKVKSSS